MNQLNHAFRTSCIVDIGVQFCRLREFPYFLRNQHQLELLDLSSNNIQGQIPILMSNVSIKTLVFLDLSNNSLTGFDREFPVVLPWSWLYFLKLDSNVLEGSLPVLPMSATFYSIKNNSLTGEIPQIFCNLSSLSILDISHNNLSGEIPMCLGNFSEHLSALKLRGNNFHGPIPPTWAAGLQMIDLGENKLQGKIPRSLIECRMLEYIDLGKNQITDAFPSWLGTLPELNILLLCSNELSGLIGDPGDRSNFVFPNLRIIDISHNKFSGTLPSGYFQRWNAMKSLDVRSSSPHYMLQFINMNINVIHVPRSYDYSMTFTNKGVQMEYPKIIRSLVAIDFSSNRFDGKIPESIGNLKGLHLLNFSNNILSGGIPMVLAKLTNLEALDLSQNKQSGRIPWELSTQLTFLSLFNVSHNHLTGRIPQGQQFGTFDQSSSFDGNLGLCGKPLLKECDNFGALPPISSTSEDSGLLDGLTWKVVLLGYGSGFLIGMVIGHFVTSRKLIGLPRLTFSKIHGRRRQRMRMGMKTCK